MTLWTSVDPLGAKNATLRLIEFVLFAARID